MIEFSIRSAHCSLCTMRIACATGSQRGANQSAAAKTLEGLPFVLTRIMTIEPVRIESAYLCAIPSFSVVLQFIGSCFGLVRCVCVCRTSFVRLGSSEGDATAKGDRREGATRKANEGGRRITREDTRCRAALPCASDETGLLPAAAISDGTGQDGTRRDGCSTLTWIAVTLGAT
jgi:hypothetical protein